MLYTDCHIYVTVANQGDGVSEANGTGAEGGGDSRSADGSASGNKRGTVGARGLSLCLRRGGPSGGSIEAAGRR